MRERFRMKHDSHTSRELDFNRKKTRTPIHQAFGQKKSPDSGWRRGFDGCKSSVDRVNYAFGQKKAPTPGGDEASTVAKEASIG